MRSRWKILAFLLAAACAGSCSKKEESKPAKADAGTEKKQTPRVNPWAQVVPHQIGAHEKSVLHVGFSPDGSLLVSTGADNLIKLWQVAGGSLVRTMKGHEDKVMMAAFSPDGTLLVSASADKTARIWDVASGKQLQVLEDKPPKKMTEEEELAYARLPPAQMNWAAFSPDGKKVITASDDFALKLWDVKTGKKEIVFQDDGCRQRRVYRRKDAAGWVSSAGCMGDGVSYMKFWDEQGNLQSVHGDEQRDAHYLAFDQAGQFIVAADGSLTFSVFSGQGSYLKRILIGGYHFCVAFGQDDKTLLVGTDRGEILVYRTGSWKREGKLNTGEKAAVDSLDISPSDGSLAIGMRNGKVLHVTEPIR